MNHDRLESRPRIVAISTGSAVNHMDMFGHHGEGGDFQAKEPGEGLQAIANPVLAMLERLLSEGTAPQRKARRTTRWIK